MLDVSQGQTYNASVIGGADCVSRSEPGELCFRSPLVWYQVLLCRLLELVQEGEGGVRPMFLRVRHTMRV